MGVPVSPEILVYGLSSASDPQVSPDGMSIVYTLSSTDRDTKKGLSQVWRSAIDGSDATRLTWTGERNRGVRWSPDGQSLAFVSDRVKKSGIFVLSVNGGEAKEITRHGVELSELAWAPEGGRIAYVVQVDPENPGETEPAADAAPRVRVTRRIDYKQDGRGYLGDARKQIFVVDVASGERRQLTAEPVDHYFPQWSPDGRWLTSQVPNRNEMCSQLGLTSVETGETRLIGPELGVVSVWGWSPASDRILFAGDTEQTWQTDLFVYDVATGQIRRLTDDLACLPVAGRPGLVPPSQPVWLDDDKVLFHAVRAGASGLYVVDVRTGRVEPIQSGRSLNVGLSVDAGKRVAVQGYASLETTGAIVAIDLATGTETLVAQPNATALAESPPAGWERFDVERGGFTTEAWLLKPSGFNPTRRYPLILDVHGGPNGHYGYGFVASQQCLATNGFLVVHSNPRGSGSYGRRFTQQVTRDWGGEDYLDLMAVVDAVLTRPYVDPERTGIFGYSYGGYMTAWTIGQTERFKAAVCGAPCFDLESMYGTSDISHHFGELQWGGAPHKTPEWYDAHSPSNFAHRARTPTLIVHGEADERCPIGQGEQMFIALKKAGCEVEFARYPGGAHSFPTYGPPGHRADYLGRVLGWFRERLMG